MRIIEIASRPNGAHNNFNSPSITVCPEGWAIIPDDLVLTSSFPWCNIKVEYSDLFQAYIVKKMEYVERPEVKQEEPEQDNSEKRVKALKNEIAALNINELNSAVYVARLILNGETVTTDEQKIKASGLYPNWEQGQHKVGDIYNVNGQTWECFQEYDNATYADITPGSFAWHTFNRPLHGKTPETARPFLPVMGTRDMYEKGECMAFTDGKIYRATMDTSFSPTEYADAWEVVG